MKKPQKKTIKNTNNTKDCIHQFIILSTIENYNKPLFSIGSHVFYEKGKRVMCANCGQQRNLWDDGRVEFIVNNEIYEKENN